MLLRVQREDGYIQLLYLVEDMEGEALNSQPQSGVLPTLLLGEQSTQLLLRVQGVDGYIQLLYLVEDMEGEALNSQPQPGVLSAWLLGEQGAQLLLRVQRVDQLAGYVVVPENIPAYKNCCQNWPEIRPHNSKRAGKN
jgi:hypothetical protein